MVINSVRVISFPPTDANGAGWDLLNGPDISLTIRSTNNTVLWQANSFYQNATNGQTIVFLPALEVNTPTAPMIFQVWDYDEGFGDDLMGGIQSIIYQPGHQFPNTFTLSCSGCSVSFEVNATYYF